MLCPVAAFKGGSLALDACLEQAIEVYRKPLAIAESLYRQSIPAASKDEARAGAQMALYSLIKGWDPGKSATFPQWLNANLRYKVTEEIRSVLCWKRNPIVGFFDLDAPEQEECLPKEWSCLAWSSEPSALDLDELRVVSEDEEVFDRMLEGSARKSLRLQMVRSRIKKHLKSHYPELG